jgi:hypothetical protein
LLLAVGPEGGLEDLREARRHWAVEDGWIYSTLPSARTPKFRADLL